MSLLLVYNIDKKVFSDEPNVNLTFLNDLKKKHDAELKLLVDIGACGLYIVHI